MAPLGELAQARALAEHEGVMRLVLPLVVVTATSACGTPPPKSAQELLRDGTKPLPVALEGGLGPGGMTSFGEVAVRVESAAPLSGKSDLTRASVDDTLALLAGTARSLEDLAGDVHETAGAVSRGEVRVKLEAAAATELGTARARADVKLRFEGNDAVERLRKQAGVVEEGAAKVARAAALVAETAELVRVLGQIFGADGDDTLLHIAADSHGAPHRATCSLKNRGLGEQRPTLSCTIVRAETAPRTVWHLNVGTSPNSGGMGEIVPASRGWLRAEPPTAGVPPLWIARPDLTVPWMRRGLDDYASFAVQRDQVAVARLRFANALGERQVWLAPDGGGLDAEARAAVDVALGILALVPWPRVPEPEPEKPR